MIQDIGENIFRNEFALRREPAAGDNVIVYAEGQTACCVENNIIAFPKVCELREAYAEKLIYLFDVEGEGFFLLLTDACFTSELPGKYSFVSVRKIRSTDPGPQKYLFAAFTAQHLAEWYLSSRFCGRCGAENTHDVTERAMLCPECGMKVYPRIDPAVIVGVVSGEKLLITRYRKGFAHNALVAGFTEIGESLEATVAREVMEEAGLKVKNIRYYKSQPWGIASNILAGFFCEAEGDRTIHMDENELKYAEWLSSDEIVLQPYDHSLTNEMMKLFKDIGRGVLEK
ncbi:MAG: NAD(+) diphosphatase [Ruminococcus sp.]|nr:NAD(+) diphosphatase [Ruminococcus sp.]